jgi:hypothetical protein
MGKKSGKALRKVAKSLKIENIAGKRQKTAARASRMRLRAAEKEGILRCAIMNFIRAFRRTYPLPTLHRIAEPGSFVT